MRCVEGVGVSELHFTLWGVGWLGFVKVTWGLCGFEWDSMLWDAGVPRSLWGGRVWVGYAMPQLDNVTIFVILITSQAILTWYSKCYTQPTK